MESTIRKSFPKSRSSSNHQGRISLIEMILQERAWKPANACIQSNGSFMNDILVQRRIGSPSANGEILKVCFPGSCDSVTGECKCNPMSTTLVLKQTPITNPANTFDPSKDDIFEGNWRLYPPCREIIALELCTYVVLHGGCPNLPLIIDYFVCDACSFTNENLIVHSSPWKSRCALILAEYANEGDLNSFLRSNQDLLPNFNKIVRNAIFQVLMGIRALQLHFMMVHGDLHPGNILVFRVPPGGYWEYEYLGEHFYCPNLGYQFVIWDFGSSLIYPKNSSQLYSSGDYRFDSQSFLYALKSKSYIPEKLSEDIEDLEIDENPTRHFGRGMRDSYATPPSGPSLGKYDMNRRMMPLPEKMERFLERGMGGGMKSSSPSTSNSSSLTF